MNVFQFFITCKRTNSANNGSHYVKLDTKRRESSFQTQLLHYFSKSDIQSNHHHAHKYPLFNLLA